MTVVQALALDINGHTLWAVAVSKELQNIKLVVETLANVKNSPIGHLLCNAVWYLSSKWRSSDIRLGFW